MPPGCIPLSWRKGKEGGREGEGRREGRREGGGEMRKGGGREKEG